MSIPIRKYPEDLTRQKIASWCDKAERCHWDVRKKLIEWGVAFVEREQLIVYLIGLDLLNEERYAKAFVHDKFTFNKWGVKKIEQNLKSKGVSERNIRDAMREINPTEYSEIVRDIIQKKEPQYKGLQLYQKKIKLTRFLMTKGFEQDLVRKELEKYYS